MDRNIENTTLIANFATIHIYIALLKVKPVQFRGNSDCQHF